MTLDPHLPQPEFSFLQGRPFDQSHSLDFEWELREPCESRALGLIEGLANLVPPVDDSNDMMSWKHRLSESAMLGVGSATPTSYWTVGSEPAHCHGAFSCRRPSSTFRTSPGSTLVHGFHYVSDLDSATDDDLHSNGSSWSPEMRTHSLQGEPAYRSYTTDSPLSWAGTAPISVPPSSGMACGGGGGGGGGGIGGGHDSIAYQHSTCAALPDIQQRPDNALEEMPAESYGAYDLGRDHDPYDVVHLSGQHAESGIFKSDAATPDLVKDEDMTDGEHESVSDDSPYSTPSAPPVLDAPPAEKNAKFRRRRHPSKKTLGPARVSKQDAAANRRSAAPAKPGQPSPGGPARYACSHCSSSFASKPLLTKHITISHTRPFTCSFRPYGCNSTFGSKNEWKRHVHSKHLRPGIWRCDLPGCRGPERGAGAVEEEGGGRKEEEEEEMLVYNDFNRKDLFTQHLKRMHAPPSNAPTADKDAFLASIEPACRRCLIEVRGTPERSSCGYCDADGHGRRPVFEGPGSWDSRMEHVGRHLESGHGVNREWREDVELRSWLASEGLIAWVDKEGWKLA